MTTLPEPNFIERDGAKILAECIAFVEGELARPLAPSQAEHVMCKLIAYRELLARVGIQEAAKQNLPAYARYPMMDLVAAIGGVGRIVPKFATTTMRFTLASAVEDGSPIPNGTRVRSKDGRVVFATSGDVVIAAGATTADVSATAEVAGKLANGYVAGQVTELLTALPFAATVTNITTTDGGAPSETTEQLRSRLPLAIRALSVAGPEDGYAGIARGAHPTIVDVNVTNPEPRTARIFVLGAEGIPTSEVLDLVEAACSSKTVRPLTDIVDVRAAEEIEFSLVAHLKLRKGLTAPQQAAVLANATQAANDFVGYLRTKMNRAYVDSQAYDALSVDGVYSVTIETVDPHAYTVGPGTFVNCTSVSVDVIGYES